MWPEGIGALPYGVRCWTCGDDDMASCAYAGFAPYGVPAVGIGRWDEEEEGSSTTRFGCTGWRGVAGVRTLLGRGCPPPAPGVGEWEGLTCGGCVPPRFSVLGFGCCVVVDVTVVVEGTPRPM